MPYFASNAAHVDSPSAWLVVAAAFIVGFVVFGILYSFGAFLAPIAVEFAVGSAAVSALFSITGLIFYFAGPITGHLGDRFGPRPLVLLGALVLAAGLALTATIGSMWVGYVTYGIGVGVGCACAYTPSLAIIGGWFTHRRNAALGIAAAGTGCGMLALPPFTAMLIAQYGWRSACVILGGLCGMLLLIAALLVRAPPPNVAPVAGKFGQTVRSRAFLLLYFSWICATTALFVPFVFLPVFARQRGIEPVAASALLSVIGAMSIGGRLGMGWLGQWIGTMRLFKTAVFMMAASYLLWLFTDTYVGLLIFAASLGLGYGIRIALMPAVLIEYFGLVNLGALLGTFFTASGIAAFVGPLAAAAIMDQTGDFTWSIGFAAGLGALGFLALLPLKPAPLRPAPLKPASTQSGSA